MEKTSKAPTKRNVTFSLSEEAISALLELVQLQVRNKSNVVEVLILKERERLNER